MRVNDLTVEDVKVLPHAIERARERWGLEGTDAEVAAQVEAFVKYYAEKRQIYDRKPKPFRTYGDDGFVPSWQRVVGCSGIWAAVIALDRPSYAAVVTVLIATPKVPGLAPRGRRR